MLPLQYGNPVTGAPFSAVRTLDFEPAPGSSGQPFHAEERIFRDGAGKTRSEITYPGKLTTIDILDLPARKQYHWTAGDTVVRVSDTPAPRTPQSTVTAQVLPPDSPLVEGVPTRHSRDIRGSSDDDREVIESWYAPSLYLSMVTIIDKPSEGKTTFRFQHVKLGEPAPALFRVPEGFTTEDPTQAPPPPPEVKESVARGDSSSFSAPATKADTPKPEYMADPKFQKALADAKQPRQTNDDRLANWKHANKLAKDQCVECLHQMVLLQMRMGAYKDAIGTAQRLEVVGGNDNEAMFAKVEHGHALMHLNSGQPKPEQAAEAEALFRQAIMKAPQSRDTLLQEGRALAFLGRNDEAKRMFDKYVSLVPASDPNRMRAERFSEDPHMATLPMAPPFRLVTSGGEEIELDAMNGRVVLLDFWATWCGPCKQSLPEIQHIAKKFEGAPFVVISISSDQNDVAWKDYIQKNNMTWPQYRDANGALSSAYGVTSIPRYFTIDSDGVLQSIKVGSDANVEGDLRKLIKRAEEAQSKLAQATHTSSSQ